MNENAAPIIMAVATLVAQISTLVIAIRAQRGQIKIHELVNSKHTKVVEALNTALDEIKRLEESVKAAK